MSRLCRQPALTDHLGGEGTGERTDHGARLIELLRGGAVAPEPLIGRTTSPSTDPCAMSICPINATIGLPCTV